MTITVDFENWQYEFDGAVKVIITTGEQGLDAATDEFLKRVVDRTPIGDPSLWKHPYVPKDYVPGTLKKSWTKTKVAEGIEIANPQPYAYRVETGWSTQAPEGMMRITILEFPEILNSILNGRI